MNITLYSCNQITGLKCTGFFPHLQLYKISRGSLVRKSARAKSLPTVPHLLPTNCQLNNAEGNRCGLLAQQPF